MYAMNKLKDTGTLYNKLHYKTLGKNPELFKSIIKENKKRGHNLIRRQAYSPALLIHYFNTKGELIITLSA